MTELTNEPHLYQLLSLFNLSLVGVASLLFFYGKKQSKTKPFYRESLPSHVGSLWEPEQFTITGRQMCPT